MRSRWLLLFGAAAAITLAVAVLAVRRGDDSVGSPSQALSRAESTPYRPVTTKRALRDMPRQAVSASAAKTPSAVQETSIPTELPDSPSLHKELSRDGAHPDYRESYTYQLGLMAFYEKCMGGRIAKGVIYYYIHWEVDEDHLAFSPVYQLADVPPEGQVSTEDEVAFAACVKEYLASHDQAHLPHAGTNGASWGMRAVFPLSDSQLLKMIAEARTKSEPGDTGSSAPPGAAAERN